MKQKVYILVECEIETSRKKNWAMDLLAVEILTGPDSKTKIISNDIIECGWDRADFR